MSLRDELKELAADLVTLRITTYVVHDLSAEAQPMDAGEAKRALLQRFHAQTGRAGPRKQATQSLMGLMRELETRAASDEPTSPSDRNTLVHLHAMQSAGLIQSSTTEAQETSSLSASQRIVLQRAWNGHHQDPVAITLVSLDGDVTTRFSKATLDNAPWAGAAIQLHGQSIDASIRMWKALASTVSTLITDLAGVVAK